MTRTRGWRRHTRPEWVLQENPDYAGRPPSPMKAICHDGSPFLTVKCACGEPMHMHESVTAALPLHAEIASRCLGCKKELVFPPGWFATAFQRLRDDGWLA